ncbi:TIGR02646 family protein [Variovorax sp. YR266]|nr:TIGR02646 family protein [Variovorax sp. YR266]
MTQLIASKLADQSFTHEDWARDELEALRHHIRAHYRRAQVGICAYCRQSVSLQSAMNCHVEHIAPKSKYRHFIFEPKNLCVICADCNAIKREQEVLRNEPDTVVGGEGRKRYPRSSNAFKIVHPHYDEYERHIKVVNGAYYLDLSSKGHFTIGACKLNRRLREFGWEAPYDDADVSAAAEKFLGTKDPLTRSAALKSLQEMLILM